MGNGFRHAGDQRVHLPGYIEALLFCYYSGESWLANGRKDSATMRGNFLKLGHDGMIEEREPLGRASVARVYPLDAVYQLTEKGAALVDHILNLPLPTLHQDWRMPS